MKQPFTDPQVFAAERGLRYVADHEPGFTRKKKGKSFAYFDARGHAVSNPALLGRFRALVIPPAWTDVWICRHANGHLQVTGRDARGRKQYRYHAQWTVSRNETKFERLKDLCALLPKLRARVAADLRRRGLPKEKVLAAVVKLLELTQIRVGNDVYAASNDSYGLTTILNRHAKVDGGKTKFRFRGKSGVLHEVSLRHPRISRVVRECQSLPGQELFEYVDENGVTHDIGSADVNSYLREATGGEITAKDLRTWNGSVKALATLRSLGPCEESSERARKARELSVIRETANHLRNTVAVCRKYYIHPAVFEADRSGSLRKLRARRRAGLTEVEGLLAALVA